MCIYGNHYFLKLLAISFGWKREHITYISFIKLNLQGIPYALFYFLFQHEGIKFTTKSLDLA
jgi:hypothetical protein